MRGTLAFGLILLFFSACSDKPTTQEKQPETVVETNKEKNLAAPETQKTLIETTGNKEPGIKDFYLLLPDNLVDLNQQERKILLQKNKFYPSANTSEESEVYSIENIDEKNGKLRIETSYTTGQSGFVTYELRSFRKKNGQTLVVFSRFGGTNAAFEQHAFKIFDYQDGKLIPNREDLIPEVLNLNSFVKSGTPDSIIQQYEDYSTRNYSLVYEGEHIAYQLHENLEDYNIDDSYLLGNTLEFTWINDKFEKKLLSK